MSLEAFKDVRCVKEAVAGTKVDTATARLFGKLGVPLGGPILHNPEDEIGSLARNQRTSVVGEEIKLKFEGDCTFEQLIYLLEMGILANGSPTGEGPYTWEYKHDLTSPTTPQTFTFQFGNDEAVYDLEYCVASGLAIAGRINEPVKMSADIFGRNFEPGAWAPAVGALADQDVEAAIGNKMKLYIDAAGGTIGNTEKTDTIISMNWNLTTGYSPKQRGGANNYFSGIAQDKPQLEVEIEAEFNSGIEAEAALWRAGTRRLFRVEIAGTGTKEIALDWSGVYTEFGELDNLDGISVVKFKTALQLDTVFTDLFSATVVNSVATLT